jgi:Arc/MetJ-type ribon-helix-helix transcriptional regulator
MSSAKIAISLDPEALREVDQMVRGGLFPSRSKLIQDAVVEKLDRLRRVRLAHECAKLQPPAERAASEERFASETEWPEY